MTTWYQISLYEKKITSVEVIKETPKFLTIILEDFRGKKYERRTAKMSRWEWYFPTYKEARDFKIDKLQDKISGLKSRLESERKTLSKFITETE